MIGRLDHIAIAVTDLDAATQKYRDMLGARTSPPRAVPDHGVTVAFVDIGNTKIELLEPLGANSPIASFLEKYPSGGMHHMCFEVADIFAAAAILTAAGACILGDGRARPGISGAPMLFLHPKDFDGTLIGLMGRPIPAVGLQAALMI